MELEERRPTEPVYRLGRRPNAWQPPEWFLAHSDGTFGNRFDDPEGYYRVLYASSQRLACFVETLARFRSDLSLLAELDAIEGEDDFVALGTLPRDWLSTAATASIAVFPILVTKSSYATIATNITFMAERRDVISVRIASTLKSLGMTELPASRIQHATC